MTSSREILEFITKNEKISLSKLSQLMGLKRAQPLYDIRDGKIKAISANYANKILSVFPEYSRAWLITGEGKPFSDSDTDKSTSENITSQSQKMYKDTITGKDKEIADLKAEIARMKSEIDKLTGQNEIMREQLGLSGRKASTKSA